MTIKMKQLLILIAACLLWPLGAFAQYEEDTENGVVSLAGKEGFSIATKKGDFVFKPYLLVQTSASAVSYTHLRSPRDRSLSRMPSSA